MIERRFKKLQSDLTVSDTCVQWLGSSVVLLSDDGSKTLAIFNTGCKPVKAIQAGCVKNNYRCSAIKDGKIWL